MNATDEPQEMPARTLRRQTGPYAAPSREASAAHEAGHTVAFESLGYQVTEVTITGRGGGGTSHMEPPVPTAQEAEELAVCYLAGGLAENLLYPGDAQSSDEALEILYGDSSDRDRLHELAKVLDIDADLETLRYRRWLSRVESRARTRLGDRLPLVRHIHRLLLVNGTIVSSDLPAIPKSPHTRIAPV